MADDDTRTDAPGEARATRHQDREARHLGRGLTAVLGGGLAAVLAVGGALALSVDRAGPSDLAVAAGVTTERDRTLRADGATDVEAAGARTRRTVPDRTTTTSRPPTTTTTLPPPRAIDGNGPSVVDVVKDDVPLVAAITANAGGRHCAVTSFDALGEQVDLLVNTTDPYEGLRPVDFAVGQRTARLQVECEGAWRVEFRSIDTLVGVGPGEVRAHRGDDVFVVRLADTLSITGNDTSRYMGVHAYDMVDGDIELLVNTTDPYRGEVISPGLALVTVQAEGDWSVTVNGTT